MTTLLLSTLLTSTVSPIQHVSATPVTTYELNYAQGEDGYYSSSQGKTITRQGTTFIAIDPWLADQSGLNINWDKSGKRASLNGFMRKIAVRVGSRTAMLDNKIVTLSAVPFKAVSPDSEKSELYVPLRFVVQALGGTQIRIDSSQHSMIADNLQSFNVLTDVNQSTTYAVKKVNGDVYIAQNKNLPKRLTSIDETLDLADIQVRSTPKGLQIIHITDSYGEPHINYQDFTLVLQNGVLLRQAHMDYHWGIGLNIEKYNGNIVLSDGQTLRIIEDGTGNVLETIDLVKLGGQKDTYVVESLQSDIILLRPISSSHLTLINRKTGQAVVLYKELLTAEQQKLVEPTTVPSGVGDELKYIKRSGNTLYLTYAKGTEREQQLTYTFNQ